MLFGYFYQACPSFRVTSPNRVVSVNYSHIYSFFPPAPYLFASEPFSLRGRSEAVAVIIKT